MQGLLVEVEVVSLMVEEPGVGPSATAADK
jgi:hypothetical protein